MPLNSIQVKLVLVGGAADTSLIYLMWHLLLICILFLGNTVHGVIDHVCRITELVVISSTIIDIH